MLRPASDAGPRLLEEALPLFAPLSSVLSNEGQIRSVRASPKRQSPWSSRWARQTAPVVGRFDVSVGESSGPIGRSRRCRGGGRPGSGALRSEHRACASAGLPRQQSDDAGPRSATMDSPGPERQVVSSRFVRRQDAPTLARTQDRSTVASFSGQARRGHHQDGTGTWRQGGGSLPLTLTKCRKPTAVLIRGQGTDLGGEDWTFAPGSSLALRMASMSANRGRKVAGDVRQSRPRRRRA